MTFWLKCDFSIIIYIFFAGFYWRKGYPNCHCLINITFRKMKIRQLNAIKHIVEHWIRRVMPASDAEMTGWLAWLPWLMWLMWSVINTLLEFIQSFFIIENFMRCWNSSRHAKLSISTALDVQLSIEDD